MLIDKLEFEEGLWCYKKTDFPRQFVNIRGSQIVFAIQYKKDLSLS